MNKTTKKIIIVISIILSIVLIYFLIQANLKDNQQNNNTVQKTNTKEKEFSSPSIEDDENIMIRVDQTLDKDGKVQNLEGVRWRNARIMQNDNKMEISIDLNNMEDVEIPSKTLQINILDKNKKIVLSKKVQMEAMTSETLYAEIEIEFDIQEYFLVYDIQIIAE